MTEDYPQPRGNARLGVRHRWLGAAAVAVHLALVTMGATQSLPEPGSTLGEVARSFMYACGSDNAYGFYAPRVSGAVRVRFVGSDKIVVGVPHGIGNEIDLRLGNAVDVMRLGSEEMQRVIAGSMAAWWLRQNADDREIEVVIEIHDLPTMAEAADGETETWHELYRGSFERKTP